MTVQTTTRFARHQGNGVTTVFPFNFVIPSPDTLQVYIRVKSTGEVTLLQPSQYVATGFGLEQGGTVTYFPGGNTKLAQGLEILIFRTVPYTQKTDLINSGGFYPEAVESQLDWIVYEIQQLAYQQTLSYGVEIGSVPGKIIIGKPGQGLMFDNDGNLIPTDLVLPPAGVVFDPLVTPLLFGAVGDGVHDDTAAFQAMVASTTVSIYLGDKRYNWMIDEPIDITHPNTVWINNGSMITYTNSLCRCLFRVKQMAKKTRMEKLNWDHQGSTLTQANLLSALDLVLQDCVSCMADDCEFISCGVFNAFGNGIGLTNYAWTGDGSAGSQYAGSQTIFSPLRVRIQDCFGFRCGCGFIHSEPWWPNVAIFINGNAGGAFNILGGSRCLVTGCIAHECATGIIIDFGAGATSNVLSHCLVTDSRKDQFNTPNNPSGWGYWIGGPQNTIVGCTATNCASDGFVFSDYAFMLEITGCIATANWRTGMVFAGDRQHATGCQCTENGLEDLYTSSGLFYPGITVVAHASAITVHFSNCLSVGTYQTYGIQVSGAFFANVTWLFGELNGTLGKHNVGFQAFAFLYHKAGTINFGVNTYEAATTLDVAATTTNTLTNAIGDSLNNGAIYASDKTDPSKRLGFGFDKDRNRGVIQAIQQSVRPYPVEINSRAVSSPATAQVGLGTAAIDNTSSGLLVGGDISLNATGLMLNAIYDVVAAQFKYLQNGTAGLLRLKAGGGLQIGTAPAGLAGATATMTFADLP